MRTITKAIICAAAALAVTVMVLPASGQDARNSNEVPREVLAFYYMWYGAPNQSGRAFHWNRVNAEGHDISDSTHYPVGGAYDSCDPAVIERHVDQAKAHEVTGFIASWWGQGRRENKALPVLLARAEGKNFKVTVYWETAPGKGQDQIDRAVSDLVYLVSRYGKSKAFLKVNGQPVIFVYGRVMGQVPAESWPTVIKEARSKAGDFMLIADGYRENFAKLFDGLHEYNNCGAVKGKSPAQLRTWAAGHYTSAVGLARKHGRISCVTVIPGYDDTKIRKPGLKAERQDGQVYRVMWEEAIKAKPDWVLITSWNEWHEGSEIEPSLELGDKYLAWTGAYGRRFVGR